MVQATVQASGFVGTGLALGCGENGGLCGGASFTAGGHFTMVHLGMGSGAKRAESSLKRTDLGIRMMTKPPASSALSEANVFSGRGNDKAMPAMHKGLSDKVLHGDHCESHGC